MTEPLNPTGPLAPKSKFVVADPKLIEVQRRGQHDPGYWAASPALADFTALGTKRLGKVAMQAGLGTDRPSKVLVFTDYENIYFAPVADNPKALDVTYPDGRAHINLVHTFTLLDRKVPANTEEFYGLEFMAEPVEVEGTTLYALKSPLERIATRHADPAAEETAKK